MIFIFSKRHEQAIREKKIRPSLRQTLRRRIWDLLREFNYPLGYQPDPNDRWIVTSDAITELDGKLKSLYGDTELRAFDKEDKYGPTDLEGFIIGAYPAQVFDVVQVFYNEIPKDTRIRFQNELNSILQQESSDWRFVDGEFFKIDSEFLAIQVLARAQDFLKVEGIEGAQEEFQAARNDLMAKDYKGAIHNACNSYESVLKTITGIDSGTAKDLIGQLRSSGFFEDIPDKVAKSFGDHVLGALPFLRNRLGGHGQGPEVVEVPPPQYAELAVHLAGAYIIYLINKWKPAEETEESAADETPTAILADDDIPF